MARYIIAERWQTIIAPATTVAAGQNPSPTATFSGDQLDASAECKLETAGDLIPNAFQEPDVVLLKRVRLWSPLLSVGLAGATITGTYSLQIRATRRAPAPVQSGELISIGSPLNLGEWVDVNQTLSALGLVAPFTGWTLGAEFPNPINLDASRLPAGLIGSLLNFSVQVEVAHSLAGIHQ